MEIEQKQEEVIDHYVKQASSLDGSALGPLVAEVTSHPALFAFSEIIAVPNVLQLEGTGNSVYLDVLRLFAHGTWSDYKSDASRLPHLVPDQVLKLKQLTVLTLAETNKVLPYHQLMQELDVINVRELEHFLINECMYAGIIRGKLDQLRKCFEFAAGRDPRPGQLGSTIQTLSNWLDTLSNLLISIQEKMKWADTMTEVAKEHKKEVGNRVEEVKKSISIKADVDFRGHEEIYSEPGGVMDYEEDRSRPKRRRHPIYIRVEGWRRRLFRQVQVAFFPRSVDISFSETTISLVINILIFPIELT
ncbi:COP9 signalosome complex subunit 7-like isoform X2 [Malus domestica]|uniref:COP9 signalosome complex subunit 7-like isoform X2 n=1 Tax=Malus domestica TaxID=3750 RepID=UPI003976B4B8